MAKVASYPKHATRYVLKEHDRTAKKYKNDVDRNRTSLNWTYGIGNQDVNVVMQKIDARCKEIMGNSKMQNNTNIMCDWIITYPATHCEEMKWIKKLKNGKEKELTYNKPVDDEHCKKFFDEAYQFACDRYGKENVLVGYVHMDEKTPHLDICFVPDTISRKNGKRTVSSASLLTKSELRKFQRDLEKHMTKVFNEKDMILNGRTKSNYTVSELKARQKDEIKLKTKHEYIKNLEENINKRENEMHCNEMTIAFREGRLSSRQKRLEERENEIKQRADELGKQEQALKQQKTDLEEQRKEFEQEQRKAALERIKMRQQLRDKEKELENQIKENKEIIEYGKKKRYEERKQQVNQRFGDIERNQQNSTSFSIR